MTQQVFQEQLAAELLGMPLVFSVPDRVYIYIPVAVAPGKGASKKVQKENSFHVQDMSGAYLHDCGQKLS